MSLRQKINNSPLIPIIAVAVVLGIAVYVISAQFRGGAAAIPTEAYFTTDEGKTWFRADINLVPPFMHDGREAVRVHLFTCGDETIVGYLAKMTPEAKAAVEAFRADMAQRPTERPATHQAAMNADMTGWLFKRPGDQDWFRGGVMTRIEVRCEDGSLAEILP